MIQVVWVHTTLMRLARCLIKSRSTSWHMLAGYEARKAWRNVEGVKDGAEVG